MKCDSCGQWIEDWHVIFDARTEKEYYYCDECMSNRVYGVQAEMENADANTNGD